MDFLAQQLLAARVRLRKELKLLSSAVQQELDREDQDRRADADAAADQALIARLNQHHVERADTREQRNPFEWLKLAVEIGTLIIVSAYTILTAVVLIETGTAADAANRQVTIAQNSFDEGRKNFQLDERAWVGVRETPFKLEGLPVADGSGRTGYRIDVAVALVNTGKTPSQNTVADGEIKTSDTPLDLVRFSAAFDKSKNKSPGSHNTLFPNDIEVLDLTDKVHWLREPDAQKIRDGTKHVYVIGKVTYTDIFQQPHYTHFCLRYDNIFQSMVDCETYNDAN